MKYYFLSLLAVIGLSTAKGQLTAPANGNSVSATVGEKVGLTDITIHYGRPAVKGREGKIWGDLVHMGFQNQGFGNGKDAPWRAGANENTTISFSTDVTIEGKPLAAGTYGLFIAYQPDKSIVIFSSATTSWGSYFYDPAEDALRVVVTPVALTESRERLTFQFGSETDSSATIRLEWEKLAIPFSVATPLHKIQMASFAGELRGEKGFDPHALVQMAEYLLAHNTQLDEALVYINRAGASMPIFSVWMTKADILEKLNQKPEADSIRLFAMASGTALEVHNYARGLLRQEKKEEAFLAFEQNYTHYPKTFTTSVGMVRGYSAMGKTKDALKYANIALPLAPDAANKKAVEEMISKLKAGKEI